MRGIDIGYQKMNSARMSLKRSDGFFSIDRPQNPVTPLFQYPSSQGTNHPLIIHN